MYEYTRQPSISAYDMGDLHKMFDLGFTKVAWSTFGDLGATGPINLNLPFKCSASIFWQERHVKICVGSTFPESMGEQDETHLWSGIIPDEIIDQGDPLVLAGYVREQVLTDLAIEKQVREG